MAVAEGKLPLVGVTIGDAAGIGPELVLKCLAGGRLREVCRPLAIGSLDAMHFWSRRLSLPARLRRVRSVEEAAFAADEIDVLDLGLVDVARLQVGVVAAEPGNAAVAYTQEAGRLALAGTIDAVVSAPLNKEAMRLAGHRYEGATEILATLCGATRFGMILLLGSLRVMMLTTHMALRSACDAVTRARVLAMVELAHETLRTFGLARPRIAVAALNPHAGEGGLFGREELEQSAPAVADARARGIEAFGPIPADTVFVRAKDGAFDLVVAMYHDQANMAAKLLGFGEVVTVLAGLPIIRTSVGHGTAFDIAGKGIAREDNLRLAIRCAAELAVLRNERRTMG